MKTKMYQHSTQPVATKAEPHTKLSYTQLEQKVRQLTEEVYTLKAELSKTNRAVKRNSNDVSGLSNIARKLAK
jgi:uncharacterized protein YoxC